MSARGRKPALVLTASIAFAAALAQPACARQDARPDAFAAYLSGEYDAAISALRALARAPDADARTHRTLVAALLETGRYTDAEAAAREGAARPGLATGLATSLGQALLAQGRRDEAERSFQQAVEARARDANTARLHLAVLRLERGEREAALDAFDAFIDIYNNAETLTARDLIAVGDAVRHLGVRDPQLFHDAVKAYDEAIKADDGQIDGAPMVHEARLRLGELFLEKYQSTEAQSLFREVLAVNPKHPRALLGMARAKSFDGSDESLAFIDQSLEVNGVSIPARVFKATLLAELEQWDDAREEVDRALTVGPGSLEALAAQAAIAELIGDSARFAATERRVLEIHAGYAELYNTIADLAVRQRRYRRAVTLASKAVALDSTSWRGWGILGINQLRNGEIGRARASLEISFAGDPYNPWIKNTLDLLDTFDEYRTVTTDRFEFMLHQSEADLLAPYITALAEEAYAALSRRYGWTPDTRIRVEVYPRHADFSVRTVGLAGLGALGVAFGNILSMDSPFARDRGTFNWGTTLWHELAHTFTLGVSGFRVPRWLTEGLSVHEERRARPGWGDDVLVEFLASWKRDQGLPVSRLNEGFVRPKFPEQVALSYYQASLVVGMIEEQHGFDAILAMLRGYGDGKPEAQVFRDALGTDLDAFDQRFVDWLEKKY
ncbi:MAG: tetratricopeptide repeat protein, partial [Gemmatimonadetes bacterium]|nr:tetratricopeptide repeat protein [Gemmatimonadota bacterium]